MENKKILVCPDCHCRSFYKPLLDIKDRKIIFLGDYMDPYPHEDTSDEQGIANLEEIIDFAKNNPNVTLLFGNHDCSWTWSYLGFERTNFKYYKDLHTLYRDNITLFQPCVWIEDTLFSHAGVCNGWMNVLNEEFELDNSNFRLTKSNICDYISNEFENELKHDTAFGNLSNSYLESHIFDIGYARWGDSPSGGPFWADIQEHQWDNFDFYQVCGHTQLKNTGTFVKCDKCFCCDSRAIFEYDLENHNLVLWQKE